MTTEPFTRHSCRSAAAANASAPQLREAIDASTTLHQVFLRFAHAFMIQATQTALANGRSKIEERLARWLLMANDRVDGDALILTHEFLATMLGVGRSGVTVALQGLERIGVISQKGARSPYSTVRR